MTGRSVVSHPVVCRSVICRPVVCRPVVCRPRGLSFCVLSFCGFSSPGLSSRGLSSRGLLFGNHMVNPVSGGLYKSSIAFYRPSIVPLFLFIIANSPCIVVWW